MYWFASLIIQNVAHTQNTNYTCPCSNLASCVLMESEQRVSPKIT